MTYKKLDNRVIRIYFYEHVYFKRLNFGLLCRGAGKSFFARQQFKKKSFQIEIFFKNFLRALLKML